MKLRHLHIIFAVIVLCLVAACKDNKAPEPTSEGQTIADTLFVDSTLLNAEEPAIEEAEPITPTAEQRPTAARQQTTRTKKASASETYYVSSYNEKGPVWGHVTMQGDSGTGVIHDSEENTYTVSCTRHGNELFAIDQNSRQYVFKLEK